MKAKHVIVALAFSCAVSGAVSAGDASMVAAPAASQDLGKTGGGTLGKTGGGTLAADSTSPAFILALDHETLSGAGTVTATLTSAAMSDAPVEANGAYDVPLTSSDEACTVPDFVTLTWSSTDGGNASFVVTCAAVRMNRPVTITAGNAAVTLLVKP